MYIKRIFFISLLALSTGCTESYTDYYQSHLNEAKLKSHSCWLSLKDALATKNAAEVKIISENPECIAAKNVLEASIDNIEFEHKIREKQEIMRLERIKLYNFNNEYAEQLLKMKQLAYLDYVAIRRSCKNNYSVLMKTKARCRAYEDAFEAKKAIEISKLQDRYSGGELQKFRDKSCTGKNFDNIYCGLAMEAVKNKNNSVKQSYLSNRNKLKKDFNKCQKSYSELLASGKYDEAQKILQSYQCEIVGDSARKLKIYNFKKAII